MKKTIWLGIILIAILATSGCSLSGNNQTSAPRTAPIATPPTTATNNDTSAINIENFAFNPSAITIKKGTAVTWTNNDSAPHIIKFPSFDSTTLNKGQSFSFTFNETGIFDYFCSLHPSMTGQIIVQ